MIKKNKKGADGLPCKDGKTNPDKSQKCSSPHDLLDMRREFEVPCSAVDRAECSTRNGGEIEERFGVGFLGVEEHGHEPVHVRLVEKEL